MKKNIFRMMATALTAALIATACTSDPTVDNECTVAVEQQNLSAIYQGEDLVLNITSNSYWHIEFVDTDGNIVRWITSDITRGRGDATVTLSVASNNSGDERTANIVVITESGTSSQQVKLVQASDGSVAVEGYTMPIYDIFQTDENNAFANGYIQGNNCVFNNGMRITRTGEDADLKFACPCHTTNTYQRGITAENWASGDAWEFTIPVKNAVSGSLRMFFGSRRDNMTTKPWTFEWSSNGETWNKFDGSISTGSDAVWKFIDFTIPAAQAVPAGGRLLLRMTPQDPTQIGNSAGTSALFQHGLCITEASAPKSTIAAIDDLTVVFSWGFDDLIASTGAYMELPLDYMTSCHGGSYALPSELSQYVAVTAGYERPGYLQLNSGSGQAGRYAVTLSHLKEMNIAKTDLKVTFRCASYLGTSGTQAAANICVKTDAASGATVDNGGKASDIRIAEFTSQTIYVRGATPETVVTITNEAESGDSRFFLDDILMQVEGTPTRPSSDEPIKVGVTELRAKYSSATTEITDNIYVQGRVVAIDNVPTDCFALADGAAGIFVKQSGHGLTLGQTAKVIAKGGTLSRDADNLLILTPAEAACVTLADASTTMPDARQTTIAELTSGDFEAMYVQLPVSEVVSAELTRTMSGNVTMELADRTTQYVMKSYPSASFAGQSVPQMSGAVKGVAGAGFVLPQSMNDLADMIDARFGTSVYAITPIENFLRGLPSSIDSDKYYQIVNATAAGKKVTFTDTGDTVEKLGGTADEKFGFFMQNNLYNGVMLGTGWNDTSSAYLLTVKATSELVGNIRLGFGIFSEASMAVPRYWKILWSNDNVTWNDDVKVAVKPFSTFGDTFDMQASSSNKYKIAYFNIPQSKSIAAGNYIYIKIMPASDECLQADKSVEAAGEVRLMHGFYLATHEKRAYNTSELPSGANVLLTEGFDESFWGHDYFLPTRQMITDLASDFSAPEGWEIATAGTVKQAPGYIMIGTSNSKGGAITTAPLTALGDTPTDITVTFKVACYLSPIYGADNRTLTVAASTGTVATQPDFSGMPTPGTASTLSVEQAKALEDAYYKFYEYSVKITSATKDTRITFNVTKGRHMLDDVVITKD